MQCIPQIPQKKLLNLQVNGTQQKLFSPSKRVEHWHNGVKLLSFVPWSKDWYERKIKVNGKTLLTMVNLNLDT